MTIKKYGILTIVIYALAYLAPGFFTSPGSAILATIGFYLAGAILLIALYLKSEKSFSFEKKSTNWPSIIGLGLAGIFIAIILQSVAVSIETMLFGPTGGSQNTAAILKMIRSKPFFILAVTIGGPIMEEFVFRRAITGLIHTIAPLWFSVALSSLLFAAIHLDGHILLYATLGLFFSLLYIKTGRIWTSIISHVGMNTLVVLISLISEIR